ncbi:MAG: oligosaccharide flippase family protein [Cellulosilyticaceae bacterium]
MEKSIKSNIFSKLLLNIFNLLLPMLVAPYIARILDIELYGLYNKEIALLGWFTPFASFGIYNYGMRFISQVRQDKDKTQKLFSSLFYISILSTSIVFIVYICYTLNTTGSNVILCSILSIQILINILHVEWMNEAFEKYRFILYKNMIVKVIYVLSIFIVIKNPTDIIKYAMLSTMAVVANNVLSYLYIQRRVGLCTVPIKELKKLIKPLVLILLLANANMFYTQLDKLFISMFGEGIEVSYYVFAQTIVSMVITLIDAIAMVTIPRLSNYIGNNKREDYKKLLKASSTLFFMIGFPMCIGLSVLSREIMYIYAGDKYIDAGIVMGIFALRYMLRILDISLANQVIFIHGKEKQLTKIYFFGGGINLILNIVIVMLGIMSPSTLIITTMISEIIVIILQLIFIKKKIDKNIDLLNKSTIKYIILSIIFYPITISIRFFMPLTYNLDLKFIRDIVIIMLSCGVFYFGSLYILKDKYFCQLAGEMIKKIVKKKK